MRANDRADARSWEFGLGVDQGDDVHLLPNVTPFVESFKRDASTRFVELCRNVPPRSFLYDGGLGAFKAFCTTWFCNK